MNQTQIDTELTIQKLANLIRVYALDVVVHKASNMSTVEGFIKFAERLEIEMQAMVQAPKGNSTRGLLNVNEPVIIC